MGQRAFGVGFYNFIYFENIAFGCVLTNDDNQFPLNIKPQKQSITDMRVIRNWIARVNVILPSPVFVHSFVPNFISSVLNIVHEFNY